MWPTEKDGRIGNFDFSNFEPCFSQSGGTNALCDSPSPGFLVPGNVRPTGLGNVDAAIAATARAGNNHTLNGQDTKQLCSAHWLCLFTARVEADWLFAAASASSMTGHRPRSSTPCSATIHSCARSRSPFLPATCRSTNAFGAQPTTLPLSNWLPFRVTRASGAGGTYVIRDNTGVTRDARGNVTRPPATSPRRLSFARWIAI